MHSNVHVLAGVQYVDVIVKLIERHTANFLP